MFIANEPFDMSNSAKLGPQQHTLSFTFSSLQFSLPKKNEYQYKLMNYDDEWIHAGNTNFARYSFLPAGDYQFKVKSSNYDGIWNNNPAHFSFSIAPDWYLTLWAKLAYVLLLIATAYWIYSYLKWRWSMKLNLQLTEKEAQRLKHLNKFKSQLYTDISHEFRTPLTLISAPIDAKLGEGNLSDFDFANFSMVKRNTNRLIALVDQLLHLAKLEKGKIKLKISKGNLGLFLGALASSFTYRAALKNIDYNVDIGELDMLWHDEDTIEKIITNLLSNAFKYCPEYGTCSFTAQKLNHEVQMDIKNTIDKSSEINLDKIFTRFYQNDEYTEGAGIGLSLVKELIELYNGKITVRIEEENQRIHFMVLLPAERSLFKKGFIVEHTKETKVSLAKNISETVSLQPDDTKKKCDNEELPILLIVEDHKEVVDFLISVWKNKYQIFTANNGKIGIKTALEIIPDLIISDVRMPVYDGVQLCNTLKMDERTSHIPIILLTAGLSEEAELKGLQSGADDFITKPFKLRILDKRVENLLASRKALRSRYNQENIVQVKDIAITPTDEIFLNKLQKILDENLSDTNFNATFLSKQLHMSRMQLHRKLLAYTGHSTSSFIRLQRLKQAVQILKTSDATINEVGYTVGFNTPSYFIKCFKETYKKTPLEYLKSEK
jgi:signal transduction histidine kinase/DNA-binding response OmpR family regulator